MSGFDATRPADGRRLLSPLVALLLAGVVAYAGAAAWSGSADTLAAVATIGMPLFIVGTLVASSSYAIRFGRWHALLRWLGHHVPVGFNVRVYLAGLALSPTPAKLGETLRSALLLPRGVPVSDSLAAFFADRLSDVIGVAALGAAAAALAGGRQPALVAIALVAFVLTAAVTSLLRGPNGCALLSRLRVPGARPWLAALTAPAIAWSQVWTLPRSLMCVLAAALAFGVQGLVFAAYVQALAPHMGAVQCVAIFGAATLIGAASMIPGGLGAMDAALVWQLSNHGVGLPQALAAVLAVRASTLWFGILLGVVMLASLARLAAAARGAK